jgi:XTP/dITP diphosphohydrolase
MKTFAATKNLGKLEEMRAIFEGSELELDTYPLYQAAAEGDTSYAENAARKAASLRRQLRLAGVRAAVLADDSGIEVAALGGRPGVLSARYAGESATWPARRQKLLAELAPFANEERRAKFCCAMSLQLEDGRQFLGYGEVDGVVALDERGKTGFGYDPLFWYPPSGKTFAEMDDREKNGISHRRIAADALLTALRRHG